MTSARVIGAHCVNPWPRWRQSREVTVIVWQLPLPGRKTKPRSLATSLHPPRVRSLSPSPSLQRAPEEAVVVSAGLQSTLYSTLRTGTMEVFFSLSGRHMLLLIPVTGGKDTEVISGSHHYWGETQLQRYQLVSPSSSHSHLLWLRCWQRLVAGYSLEPQCSAHSPTGVVP